jgi:hypothetical protein
MRNLMEKTKLKIGLLLNSFIVEAWQHELIRRLIDSDFLTLNLIVMHHGTAINHAHPFLRWLIRGYCRVDRNYFKTANIPDACESRNLHQLVEASPNIKIHETRIDPNGYFFDEDVNVIIAHHLDVLVQISPSRLQGHILDAAQFGVWAYRFGIDDEYFGFHEVIARHPATRSRLVILGDANSPEMTLSESWFTTDKRSAFRNRNNVIWKSLPLLLRNLESLHVAGKDEFTKRIARHRKTQSSLPIPLRRKLTCWKIATGLVRHVIRFIHEKIAALFSFEQWILLIAKNNRRGNMNNFTELVPPRGTFWADPFILYRDKAHYIFVEAFPESEAKGNISVLKLDENGKFDPPIKLLEKPYHLSYPFIFEHDEKLFMIPETRLNKTIELYECLEFPTKWAHKMNLMENVDAVDTTLFFYEKKWWLFTGILHDREKLYFSDLYYDELYLFHSESLFSKDWIPHPRNPVITDVRKARPAGRIHIADGKIIRPSQDCSVSYGYGIRFNEIIRLDEAEYEEVERAYIQPNWKKAILATHTYNRDETLTVIDAVKRRNKWF